MYVRYHHPINSTELVTRLRTEKGVLIVPGDHFGMDGHLRIGFGEEPQYLRAALERAAQGIADCGLRRADSLRNAELRNADSLSIAAGLPNARSADNPQSPINPQSAIPESAINPQSATRNPQ